MIYCEFRSKLHAVSRTQQGRQNEPGNLVNHQDTPVLIKTHPFLTFRRILEALRIEWRNSTPSFAWTPWRRNGNMNFNKYLISSSGDRTHNQSHLQSQFVPLGLDWPDIHMYIRLNTLRYVTDFYAGFTNGQSNSRRKFIFYFIS